MPEKVNHPPHYGGDTIYEAIKVIEARNLGFCFGNTVKYVSRAGKKGERLADLIEDLEKARWYLDREINNLKRKQNDTKRTSAASRRVHGTHRPRRTSNAGHA